MRATDNESKFEPRIGVRRIISLAVLLFALAFLWRWPWSTACLEPTGDESSYSIPTIKRILNGEKPLMVHGTSYMGPANEYVSALLVAVGLPMVPAVRLPVVVFASLTASLFFLALLPGAGLRRSLAIAAIVACPPIVLFWRNATGGGGYGAGEVFIPLLILSAMALDRWRQPAAWAGFGVLAGLAIFIFPVTQVQLVACLGWLAWRSPHPAQVIADLRSRLPSATGARYALLALLTIGVGSAVLLGYYYLTRRSTFTPGVVSSGALIVSATTFFGIGLVLLHALWKRSHPVLASLVLFVVGCLASLLPLRLGFRLGELPRLEDQGIAAYRAGEYALHHAHEWPDQLQLFFTRVWPAILFGKAPPHSDAPPDLVWLAHLETATGAGILVALAAFYAWRFHRQRGNLRLREPVWLFAAATLLLFFIWIPSWRLVNVYSVRYLFGFLPGLLLILFEPLRPAGRQWPWLAACALYIYLMHNYFTLSVRVADGGPFL